MKILLVNPVIPHAFRLLDFADEKAKRSIGRRVMVGPPLALNELAGMVPEEEIIILDQKTELDNNPQYDYLEAYKEELEVFKPDIVCITCITAQYNATLKILEVTKKYNPEILTMVGGIHPTLCKESFIGTDADILTIGLGKNSFRMIVEVYKAQGYYGDYSKIPGLALNKDNRLIITRSLCSLSYSEIKENYLFDKVMPNRVLTDKYNYTIKHVNQKIHYLSTSSGCTHKCNFCSIWQTTNGLYFHKDVETIIDELKTMDQYHIIRFCDANTFGDIKKARLLFNRIIEEGLDFHDYMADVRTDTVLKHPDLIELAVKAGLKIVICGLEATSDEELKAYNKDNTVENITKGLRVLNDLGVYVNGNYIVKPEYVEKDFERLAKFVEDNPIYHSGFTVLTPFPGTPLWEEVKDQITIKNFDYYNLTNAVVKTTLPEKDFYLNVAELYKTSLKTTDKYLKIYGNELLTE
ncbi:B12-binding domain-containing radical SAM protein [Alkaliphilus transvaalensis]|uniref:B12-binding domain-containing radical SAM protein n=1 Tax=Alkaliphilus transvaalensis TaxID=114628 RepID=UPI00047DEA89|nr:radical SAM protein [Alkaliphilus transvaalensis]